MGRNQSKGEQLSKPADHYVFVAHSYGRVAVIALLMIAFVGAGFGIYFDATIGGRPAAILTAVCAVLTVALWATLQARIPQRIEVDRAVITIIRSGARHRYDLEDPGVELRVRDGEIAFAHYMQPWTVVRAKEVDWRVFTHVVMHYQNNADVNAELRDQRFAR